MALKPLTKTGLRKILYDHTLLGDELVLTVRSSAADATSHLFFAYLRSLTPDVSRGVTGISSLPISLQTLVEATEYPPETPTLLQVTTTKVVMIVDTVSPTPFSLLRRAKNFEYRDDHWHLQEFANYEDPIKALTDECLRVLKCISSTNESSVSSSKQSTSLRDASWSRFEDIGFGGAIESDQEDEEKRQPPSTAKEATPSMHNAPQSQNGDLGRPTTPSWADFMSSGFSEESNLKTHVGPLLLPPDKVLPPIAATRGQSSQSHKRSLDAEPSLEPAELASINSLDLDDSFWWVWITSLSGDEPSTRKAVFGRCALVETVIRDTKWLVLEEQVKGAAPEPEAGAQIVEKKRFFSFGSRKGTTKLGRRKSSARKVNSVEDSYKRPNNQAPQSKTSIGPDQHKRIQAAAAALQKRHREQEAEANYPGPNARADARSTKTNSVMTLQPAIVNEASSAMKWASNYDKNAFRSAYLRDTRAGTGAVNEDGTATEPVSEPVEKKAEAPLAPLPPSTTKNAPPPPPKDSAADVTPLPPSPEPAKKTLEKIDPEADKENVKLPDAVVVEQPTESEAPQQPAEESNKKPKKKAGNTGFKSMFGTSKKNKDQQAQVQAPIKTPTKETSSNSAVAAARAALEAKAKAAHEIPPKGSPPKAALKKKPVPGTQTPVSKPSTPAQEPEKPATPQTQKTEFIAEEHQEQQTPQQPTQIVGSGSPPQTRRGVEYDALSRVDTNERDAADQEFSKFDQGPLVDQPAFVPEEDGPITPNPMTEPEVEVEVPRTPTNGHEERVNDISPVTDISPVAETSPNNSSMDRWAQIRENAAKRVAEEPETRTSQSERTDEGDTSGEESKSYLTTLTKPNPTQPNCTSLILSRLAIEARVARIKARVAELTGNTEGTR